MRTTTPIFVVSKGFISLKIKDIKAWLVISYVHALTKVRDLKRGNKRIFREKSKYCKLS